MKKKNIIPKNKILNNLVKSSTKYPKYILNKHNSTSLTKNFSNKFIKKNSSKIKDKKNHIIYNYKDNINSNSIQKNIDKFKNNKISKEDSLLMDFYSPTGENIFCNNSKEQNYILTETNSTDIIKIKNLNSATIAILKENIPVSVFNDKYYEPFNINNNLSKELFQNDNINDNNYFNYFDYNNSVNYMVNDRYFNDKNNNTNYSNIKPKKIIRNIQNKKNEIKIIPSKSYNKGERLFIPTKKIDNNNEKKINKRCDVFQIFKVNHNNNNQKSGHRRSNISKLKKKIFGTYNRKNYRINKSESNKNCLSKSNEMEDNIIDNKGNKIKKQNINNTKNKKSTYINKNNSKSKKEKELFLTNNNTINNKTTRKYYNKKFNITEIRNIDKSKEKIPKINNEDYFIYKEYINKKYNNNDEYHTLNNYYQVSKKKLNIDNKNNGEIKKNFKIRNKENKIFNQINTEKKNIKIIMADKKYNNIYNISNIIKVNKKSNNKSKKNSLPKTNFENNISLNKKNTNIKKSNILKKARFFKNNYLKKNKDNSLKFDIFSNVNESLENIDICNKPIVSNYIQTPFITQKKVKRNYIINFNNQNNNIEKNRNKIEEPFKDDISIVKKIDYESEFDF